MVKAPSSHGLHQKYKPWRKGKSQKTSKPSSSLKQQLRGVQRLIQRNGSNPELEAKRKAIEEEIASRQKTEIEKTNATTSHRKRFIERQRTMRMYTKLMKEKEPKEDALLALALDQVFIAHYPLDQSKYLNLYANNQQRRTDMNARTLYKIAKMRSLVLERLAQKGDMPSSSWVPSEQYKRIAHLTTWSTAQERSTFAIRETGAKAAASATSTSTSGATDDRFQVSAREQELLAKADDIVELEVDEDGDESDASQKNVPQAKSIRNNQGDDSDNGIATQGNPSVPTSGKNDDDDNDAASVESSSSGSSSSDSSSSSSESSPSSSVGVKPKAAVAAKNTTVAKPNPSDSILNDGFLVAEPTGNVFENAPRQVPTIAQGDKSQGWATQRQIPGQFRKKQRRT